MPLPLVVPLALAATKVVAPFAVKAAFAAKSAGLFSFLSSHGIAVSAGAQSVILTAAAAAYIAKQQGKNEEEQLEAATKAVARAKLTSLAKPKVIKAVVDYLN